LAERAYERLAQRYGHRPATPIRVELYERHEDFSVRTVGLAGIDILGVSFGPVVALDSPSSKAFGDFHWGSALWHELAHTFHLDISASRVPRWFSEGLAVHEEHAANPGWGAVVTPDFLRAYHQGLLPTISSLNQAFLRPSYPDQMLHAYFQSSLLMSLIERDYGFDAINQMLRGYRRGKSTAELAREVLGLELEALDVAFDQFVRQRYQHALDALFGPGETAHADGEVATFLELMSTGRAALETQALDQAEQLFLQAQARFPEHAGPGSSYRQLATLYRQRGQTEAAEHQLRKAIAIRADDLGAHGELAGLHLANENWEAAAAVLEQSLMIEPFDPEVHARLAEIHEQQQAWAAATRERAAVVALDPADPIEERLRLAKVLNRSGDTTAARHEVLRVLEAAPLYDDALELLLEVRANQSAPKGTDLFWR
jgi:tetratricopeptide (TPR) repeat protein